MTNRGKTKKKTVNKSPKNTFNSDEIISGIQKLRNSYIQYDSKSGKLKPVEFSSNSKNPFNRIIFMIKNSENLEKRSGNSYVFPYLFDTYLNDIDFLIDNISKIALETRNAKKIIPQFDTLYIEVIIECIREYLKPKYKTENTIHFWETIQKLCENISVKEKIIYSLKMNQDALLKNPEFLTLCNKIMPTEAYYGPHIVMMDNHNHSTSSYVLASELPRNLTPVIAEREPIYYDIITQEPIYDNPITWVERRADLLPKISRSRSRGGKRKTKKSTKRK
jgi:hypothetical protein